MIGIDLDHPILTREEEQTADVETLVRCNLRFAALTVNKFIKQYGLPGNLDTDDLFQSAIFGLYKAAKRFDPEKGNRFSTYAGWWVRHAIQRTIQNEAYTIREPVYHQAARTAARKRGEDFPPPLQTLSLDAPITEGEGRDFYTRMPADGEDPEQAALRAEKLRGLREALERAELTERERYILDRRFGLDGRPIETLQQIGERLGVSRERVRQLEGWALKCVRKAATIRAAHRAARRQRGA